MRMTALAVDKAAHDVEAGAKARSRVDTGQMKSGWTTERHGEHRMDVVNPVEHTIFNEFGTIYMGAQPMAVPAAEEVRPGFVQAVRRAWSG
jgi:HK97 gp10 family phage protein